MVRNPDCTNQNYCHVYCRNNYGIAYMRRLCKPYRLKQKDEKYWYYNTKPFYMSNTHNPHSRRLFKIYFHAHRIGFQGLKTSFKSSERLGTRSLRDSTFTPLPNHTNLKERGLHASIQLPQFQQYGDRVSPWLG